MQGNLLSQGGEVTTEANDKVVMSLVNVEEERLFRSVDHTQRQDDGSYARSRPETRLNLYLLFIANLNNYDEAARCYLQTLSLNPAATHCWSYLRIALSCSERWDLIPLAANQDLTAFQDHFDFVLYNNSNGAAANGTARDAVDTLLPNATE